MKYPALRFTRWWITLAAKRVPPAALPLVLCLSFYTIAKLAFLVWPPLAYAFLAYLLYVVFLCTRDR